MLRHRKYTQTSHIYLRATRNSEAGLTGKHQEAAVSFSKQELKPINTTQTLLFITYEEVAEVQTVLLLWGNEKTKMREHKLFHPEKAKLGLDLNCFFTAIPCYPTDRIT